jgi:hypothetical protein
MDAPFSSESRIISTMAAEESDGVGGFRVIVPSSKATRIFLLVFGSLTIIGGLITLTLGTNGVRTIEGIRLLGTGLTMLASGALFFMILWLWSVNAALLIGQGVVGYRNIFRRREFWSPGEIGRVVEMAISYGWWTSQPQRAIYLFGLDGRQLVVLTPRMWNANDLRDFIDATGIQPEVRDAPVTAKALRREFPKGFGWVAQHNLIAGCITSLAAVALVVGGYVLVRALFSR